MQKIIKRFQLGFVSLSALALLAACGDDTPTQNPAVTDDPAVQEPAQPEETDPTDDAADDTAGTDDTTGTDDSAATDSGTVDTSNGISNVDFPVTFEQAVQTFYDTFGEGINIDEIELDDDDGVYEYSISGWDDQNEYDVDIDAETGEIREQETDRENDDDDEMINIDSLITPQEAMDIAIQETGSDRIEGWKIEVDDGMTVIEVDFEGSPDDDITLNAETGEVVDR